MKEVRDTSRDSEPAAWAVYDGDEIVRVFMDLTPAETLASAYGFGLVALYRDPPASRVTLTEDETEEEREAMYALRAVARLQRRHRS